LRTRLVDVCGMDDDRAAEVLGQIARFRARALFGFPGNLEMLARVGRARSIPPPGVDRVIPSGEMLTDEARRAIRDYFDARVYDRYGSAEVQLIGQQCPAGNALHVPPTRLIVEGPPIAPQGDWAAQGDAGGELLLTDLDNRTTPFIRYAIGDAGQIGRSQCPCGRGGQVIERLWGRSCDLLFSRSGRLLHEQFWSSLVRLAPGVERYQVVQLAAGRLDLRIVTDGRYRDSVGFFRRIVRDYAGDDVELSVTRVERIEPPAGGKRRFVIRMDQADRVGRPGVTDA